MHFAEQRPIVHTLEWNTDRAIVYSRAAQEVTYCSCKKCYFLALVNIHNTGDIHNKMIVHLGCVPRKWQEGDRYWAVSRPIIASWLLPSDCHLPGNNLGCALCFDPVPNLSFYHLLRNNLEHTRFRSFRVLEGEYYVLRFCSLS
jgi:hypothetical protein